MYDSNNNRNFDFTIVKHELQNLIQGNGREGEEDLIQAIACYLRASKVAGAGTQKNEYSKEQEAKSLISFIDDHALWYEQEISEEHKIGAGAEQTVYYYP